MRRRMVNGQLLFGDKEESNATAEATDYSDNEDLLSARKFQALQSWNESQEPLTTETKECFFKRVSIKDFFLVDQFSMMKSPKGKVQRIEVLS